MDFYFITLAVLLFVSNIFWAIVCHKLIDKLMSRTYFDYKVADTVKSEKKKEPQKHYDNMDDLTALNEIIP